MTMGQLMGGWPAKHRGEDTTKEGYEPKFRLLGPQGVRHIHNIISAAPDSATGPRKLLTVTPAHTANPPTERQIKAATPDFPTLDDHETAHFLQEIWKPCGNRACDDGLTHRCLRDAPLWTAYAATSCRRSEVLGWKWSLSTGMSAPSNWPGSRWGKATPTGCGS